jgi:hypothetical protein
MKGDEPQQEGLPMRVGVLALANKVVWPSLAETD